MKKRMLLRGAAAASLVMAMATAGAQASRWKNFDSSAEMQPGGDPQAKDDLLEGLDKLGANAKERNEVNLDKNMLALAGGKKGGRYAGMADKMDFVVVRNYEFASKGQYQKSDLDMLRHRLEGTGWSHIVRNESDGETNDIVVKTDNEGFIRDMVILNAEAKEVNIVHLRGRFRMEDVQGAMGQAMGAGMGALGGAMGGAMGRVAAAPPPPPPPDPPALKTR